MAAVGSIQNSVLVFPDYDWSTAAEDAQFGGMVGQLYPNMSFAQNIVPRDIQTLTSHNTPDDDNIAGFTYVPELGRNDACYNLSKSYIPANVTRRANLPQTDFSLVAVAPWINVECTKSYLAAARLDPCRAFLFYLPGNDTLYNGTSWAQVSPARSPVWDLQDGGVWKSKTSFPVYALSPVLGIRLMIASSLYSGNMTSVPFGHDITEMGIDPRDYVRIYSQIYLNFGSGWPGLWGMILVILGVLIAVLILMSIAMHLVQLVRRNDLRRRVESGEVDLQAMGIAKFRVPYAFAENLPLWTYSCESALASAESTSTKDLQTTVTERQQAVEGPLNTNNTTETLAARSSEASTSDDSTKPPHKFLPYTQPTCAICLEDYEAGVTTIRELPCGHIFHPECIDWALRGGKYSVCPLCKQTVLPENYCPRYISSYMVRRERQLRSLRATVMSDEETRGVDVVTGTSAGNHALSDFWDDLWRFLRPSSTSGVADPDIPLRVQPQPTLTTNIVPVEVDPNISILASALATNLPPGLSREEIARQRIPQLMPDESFVEEAEAAIARQIPKWRRVLSRIFPGFT